MLDSNNMLTATTWQKDLDSLFHRISEHYVVDEEVFVGHIIDTLNADPEDFRRIADKTAELVREVRDMDTAVDAIDELLQQYSLDTHEGLMLMCLAEAMLRIPDKSTADALIEDKLGPADWNAHLGKSESWMVNASIWGLLMTGRVVNLDKPRDGKPSHFINKLVNRMGEPVIRRAMYEAMKIMGKQFVLGRDIDEALKRSRPLFDKGYTYSYDMLGEAARTRRDAERYFKDYARAIEQLGIDGYPVFTRKASTDVNYLVCARFLLSEQTRERIFPQFATHNAHTISAILEQANEASRPFEFQCLHGMGEALYDAALKRAPKGTYCRIYAPVGAHKDLLPYLVRRSLENGANSSFVHQLVDPKVPVESLCEHPVQTLGHYQQIANPRIPMPADIYGPKRRNSRGVNLNVRSQYQPLRDDMAKHMETTYQAGPLLAFKVDRDPGNTHEVNSPFDRRKAVGTVQWTPRTRPPRRWMLPGPPSRVGMTRRSPSGPRSFAGSRT